MNHPGAAPGPPQCDSRVIVAGCRTHAFNVGECISCMCYEIGARSGQERRRPLPSLGWECPRPSSRLSLGCARLSCLPRARASRTCAHILSSLLSGSSDRVAPYPARHKWAAESAEVLWCLMKVRSTSMGTYRYVLVLPYRVGLRVPYLVGLRVPYLMK